MPAQPLQLAVTRDGGVIMGYPSDFEGRGILPGAKVLGHTHLGGAIIELPPGSSAH